MTPVDFFRSCLAMLSAAAGLVHLAAAPAHFSESPLHGAFFVVVGFLQVFAGGMLLRGGGTWALRAIVAGNVGVLAVWTMSRTTGMPVGPERWTPEPVGLADATCCVLELLTSAGAIVLLTGRGRRWLEGARLRGATTSLVAAGSALFVLTAFSVAALGTGGHVHAAGEQAHPAEAAHAGAAHRDGTGHDQTAHTQTSGPTPHGHAGAGAPESDGHAHVGAGAAPHAHIRTEAQAPGVAAHSHTASGRTSHAEEAGHDHAAAPAAATQAIGPAADDRRTTVRYGPFVLPPASLGGMLHLNVIQPALVKPCSNCFITSIKPDLVYADGTSANLDTGPMLHHAVWTRPLVPDATCGKGTVLGAAGERFFAAGNERTPLGMPTGFGYLVGDDPWLLVTEIMNHSDGVRIVFVELDVTYRPATDTSVKPVKPVWLDVANCSTSEYQVPAGASETGWSWTSSVTGRVVSTAGHLHDGGTTISLVNETTGRHLCTSAARYGTKPGYAGTLDAMTGCAWDALGTVRAGEVLGIRSRYEMASPANDVMGIMLVYVHPTDDLDGGTPAPDSVTQAAPAGAPPPAHAHH